MRFKGLRKRGEASDIGKHAGHFDLYAIPQLNVFEMLSS